jgi:hypothetical protein
LQEAVAKSTGSQELERLLGEGMVPIMEGLRMLVAEQQVIKVHLSDGLQKTCEQLLREVKVASTEPRAIEHLREDFLKALEVVTAGVSSISVGQSEEPAPHDMTTVTAREKDALAQQLMLQEVRSKVHQALPCVALKKQEHLPLLKYILDQLQTALPHLRGSPGSTSPPNPIQFQRKVKLLIDVLANDADDFPDPTSLTQLSLQLKADVEAFFTTGGGQEPGVQGATHQALLVVEALASSLQELSQGLERL